MWWSARAKHKHSTAAVLSAPCMNTGHLDSPSNRGRLQRLSDSRARPQCLRGQQKREVHRLQTVCDIRPTYAVMWTSRPVVCAVFTPVAMSSPWTRMKLNNFFQWNSQLRSMMIASKRSTGLPVVIRAQATQQAQEVMSGGQWVSEQVSGPLKRATARKLTVRIEPWIIIVCLRLKQHRTVRTTQQQR